MTTPDWIGGTQPDTAYCKHTLAPSKMTFSEYHDPTKCHWPIEGVEVKATDVWTQPISPIEYPKASEATCCGGNSESDVPGQCTGSDMVKTELGRCTPMTEATTHWCFF